MTNPLKKAREGFTIIEVMIVLAIAGLIMVIVFIAVPQLQRNTRNSQRRTVTNNLFTEVNTWSADNGGSLPTVAQVNTLQVNIDDPTNGTQTVTAAPASPPTARDTATPWSDIYYGTTIVCNGNTYTATGASARNYAVYYVMEGATYCRDNK